MHGNFGGINPFISPWYALLTEGQKLSQYTPRNYTASRGRNFRKANTQTVMSLNRVFTNKNNSSTTSGMAGRGPAAPARAEIFLRSTSGGLPFCGRIQTFSTMSLGLRPNSLPSGILIHPAIWAQYTNVTDRQDRHNRPTDNGPIAYGEPSYKRMPKNGSPYAIGPLSACLSVCLYVCPVLSGSR